MTAPPLDAPRDARPLPRWVDLAVLGFSLAFACWLAFFSHGDPALRDLVDTLFFLPLGGAVAWITWRTARIWPHDSATRRAWQLIALSHLLTWIGGSLWSGLMILSPALGNSKWADILSLPSYPLALWGVLSFPGLYRYGTSRLRLVLDTALILVGAGLGAWYFGYLPALSSPESSGNALYIAFTFPAIDIAMVAMTGASYLRASHLVTRTALGWMVASKIAVLAGDGYYGLLRLTTGYYPGHWTDALWFGAWILAWVAARSVQTRVARGTTAAATERVRSYRSEALPPVFVLGAQGLLLWVLRGRLTTSAGVAAITASVIAVLIILRQLAELRENNRLFERERQQEARFRSLVQQGNDVLLVVGSAGTILYRIPSAERLFGSGTGGAREESIGALFEPSDGEAPFALLARLLSGHAEGPIPVRFRKPDGTLVHLEFVTTDLRAEPAVGGVVLTGRDVTERKELEDEVLHGQKMRAIGQLAGGFAHDFNNILAGLRGHLDLILEDLPDGSQTRMLADDIAHASDRAAAITRQLLQFGRREVVRPATFDLNAVLSSLEPMLRQLLPPGIDLRLDCGLGPLWIFIDRSQLEQVVLNLTVNARDAMEHGGKLLIRTSGQRLSPANSGQGPEVQVDSVSLLVQDTGIGMDDKTLARIFEPFFTTKPSDRGTGLGLATVRGHVTSAGGRVLVKSQPGLGATFTVIFPRADAAAESSPAAPVRRAAGGAGARVLLVEDDETVRRVTARMLERKGYRVSQARSGEEALELLVGAEVEVDLVLTDLMMPGMGGAGLLTRLAESFPDLPVVCMSGHAADEASQRHAGSSAVTFLAKPFTADEIFQVTATALARRRGRA